MATNNEKTFTFRLPGDLLDAANAEAERRDETLARVLRRAMREYIQPSPPAQDRASRTRDV